MTGKRLRKIIRQLIALNILYITEKKIYSAYMSKFNLTREEEIFLMILNEEKEGWQYLAVKNYLHYYME